MNSRHRLTQIFVASACIGSTSAHAAFLDIDFSAETVGTSPSSLTVSSPAGNTAELAAEVVDSSVLDGNAVRFFDNQNTSSPGPSNISVTQALSGPINAGIFSLDFTGGPQLGSSGNSFLRISVGSASINPASSSSGSTYQRVVVQSINGSNVGRLLASDVGGGSLSDATIGSFDEIAANELQIVFNNSGDAIDYTLGGSQSVANNRYDVFLNGVLVADDFQLRTSSGDVVAIGFGTGGSQTGADWVFDNLAVTEIPEPGVFALASAAGFVLLGRRRMD